MIRYLMIYIHVEMNPVILQIVGIWFLYWWIAKSCGQVIPWN